MNLLMLVAKFPCEIKELLPTLAMRMLISTHGAAVVAVLVKLVKLWGLEQHHDQLEALQLHCGPFRTLFRVAVLSDDGVQLLRHGLEAVTPVRGARHLGPRSLKVIHAWIRRHVGHVTRMH